MKSPSEAARKSADEISSKTRYVLEGIDIGIILASLWLAWIVTPLIAPTLDSEQ